MDEPSTCSAGERCAWGRVEGARATRCVTEPGSAAAGADCALDVLVSFDDGHTFRTSRCGAGLACSVGYDGVAGECVQPCDELGCVTGDVCPGAGEACVRDVRCDLDTHAPCAATERCEHVVPYGAASGVWLCRESGDLGAVCGNDGQCQRALACSGGRCRETCDPEWRSVPPGTPGSSPLPNGGALLEPRCADGSRCSVHWRDDDTRTGVCLED